jgi:hypothetical protein
LLPLRPDFLVVALFTRQHELFSPIEIVHVRERQQIIIAVPQLGLELEIVMNPQQVHPALRVFDKGVAIVRATADLELF